MAVSRDSRAQVTLAALQAYSRASPQPFGQEFVYAHRHPDGFQEPVMGSEACAAAYYLLLNLRKALT